MRHRLVLEEILQEALHLRCNLATRDRGIEAQVRWPRRHSTVGAAAVPRELR